MLSLSQTTGYAILALTCLEARGGRMTLVQDVAACTGIPRPFLGKIVHALSKKGLVKTKRGYKGGFVLARSAKKISLLEVAEAIEGPHEKDWCLLGLPECSDVCDCPTHRFWEPMRKSIIRELRRMTVAEAAKLQCAQCPHAEANRPTEAPAGRRTRARRPRPRRSPAARGKQRRRAGR